MEFTLPDCLQVVATTPALDDLPQRIVVATEHVMVSDSEGHHLFDPQGTEIPLPPDGFLGTCRDPAVDGHARPDILRVIPGTTWLLWQDARCVGVTDVLEIINDPTVTTRPWRRSKTSIACCR